MRDRELLAEYAQTGSGEAFTELVRRHAPMVYSTCLRVLSDSHAAEAAAEDAAQAAFIVLARKARRLPGRVNLSGWLFLTARSSALQMRRAAARRARHEREGAEMREREGATWDAVRPRLDEALAALPRVQRDAVVLRYLEGRSAAEVAETMNASPAATEKRLARGLARLRERLARRGAAVGGLALAGLLAGNATVALPASFSSSIGAACLGGASASPVAASVAKGVIRMMFWAKVKLCAAALAAVAVVGTGTGVVLSSAGAGEGAGDKKKVRVKDSSGKTWELNDWAEGTRPYKKNLLEREKAYKETWGEHWAGAPYKSQGGAYTMTPGTWKWEELVVIPDGKKACPSDNPIKHPWSKSQALVYAPGGTEDATAVYAVCTFGFYHVDPKTKATQYVGWMPTSETVKNKKGGDSWVYGTTRGMGKPQPPPPGGYLQDGLDDKARLVPKPSTARCTVDPVTGRVYFMQGTVPYRNRFKGPYKLRYVEKLLPYTVGGRELLLPAFLDHDDLFKKIGAEPVMKNGVRAPPRFAVRTTPVTVYRAPGFGAYGGNKIMLSPDGRSVFIKKKKGGYLAEVHQVEIDTGKELGAVRPPASVPRGAAQDGHGAVCMGSDGVIYQCKHTGCGGGPGRLFRVDTATGRVTMLYDSMPTWDPNQAKKPAGYRETMSELKSTNDGPADATTLRFITTNFQFTCPRTGAVYNGGWDCAGIRRYHDGFVTSLAQTSQMGGAGGRPEWGKEPVACFGSLAQCPDTAPNGDVYLTNCQDYGMFKGAKLRVNGIRIVRLYRTDWPEEQPVNGYANKFLPPEKREKLMLEYAKKYIANYAELSKIY